MRQSLVGSEFANSSHAVRLPDARGLLHRYQRGLVLLVYKEFGDPLLKLQSPLCPAKKASNWGNRST